MAAVDERDKILKKYMNEWDELNLDLIITPASLMPAPLKVKNNVFLRINSDLTWNILLIKKNWNDFFVKICLKVQISRFFNHYWILKDILFSLNLFLSNLLIFSKNIYPILYPPPWKLLNRYCHNVFKLFEHHANHMLWQ